MIINRLRDRIKGNVDVDLSGITHSMPMSVITLTSANTYSTSRPVVI